jgi:putative sigma-54 modulation protein
VSGHRLSAPDELSTDTAAVRFGTGARGRSVFVTEKGVAVDVRVHGKNFQISTDLKSLADEKIGRAGRIFDDGGTADVEFEERTNPRISNGRYRVEITSRAAGHTVRVEATGHDDRAALDIAVDKFERQLRRLKERLVQRSRKASNKHLNDAVPVSDDTEEEGPRIVRTKRFAMRPMLPEEAALQMEMLEHDFFFFLNAETGVHCVLYHRRDGELGLIEPE